MDGRFVMDSPIGRLAIHTREGKVVQVDYAVRSAVTRVLTSLLCQTIVTIHATARIVWYAISAESLASVAGNTGESDRQLWRTGQSIAHKSPSSWQCLSQQSDSANSALSPRRC